MIEARPLSRRYGRVGAVDGLSIHVLPGRVTGFLGPKGASNTPAGSGSTPAAPHGLSPATGNALHPAQLPALPVPSTVAVLGRWSWWPSARGRPVNAAPDPDATSTVN
jgi:hypothetical protein